MSMAYCVGHHGFRDELDDGSAVTLVSLWPASGLVQGGLLLAIMVPGVVTGLTARATGVHFSWAPQQSSPVHLSPHLLREIH